MHTTAHILRNCELSVPLPIPCFSEHSIFCYFSILLPSLFLLLLLLVLFILMLCRLPFGSQVTITIALLFSSWLETVINIRISYKIRSYEKRAAVLVLANQSTVKIKHHVSAHRERNRGYIVYLMCCHVCMKRVFPRAYCVYKCFRRISFFLLLFENFYIRWHVFSAHCKRAHILVSNVIIVKWFFSFNSFFL